MSAAALALCCVFGAGRIEGLPQYYSQFSNTYPASSLQGTYFCLVCHKVVGGGTRNPYGLDLRAANINFVSIEEFDSDDDGIPNIDEINAGTPPGRPDAAAIAEALLGMRSIRDGDTDDDLAMDAADIVFSVKPPF